MRVAVVAEYYPRAADPALGVWAHRQAVAARDAGADVRVLVLHRPVPSRAALASRDPRALVAPLRQPLKTSLDGIDVTYVPFVAPARPRSYAAWGAWAAPTLTLALRTLHRRWPYELVHAHYAAPGGDAVRRARAAFGDAGRTPYVVSVHGGDLLDLAHTDAGAQAVRHGLEGARLTLANSTGMAERARALGAADARVVHLGTDVPDTVAPKDPDTVVCLAHLVPRKRHADLLRALWLIRDRHPRAQLVFIGDGPERGRLEQLAETLGLADRVTFTGALPHAEAVDRARTAAIFALPSIDEAFGVAYIEAMAGGVPAIGCVAEDGPAEIRRLGEGLLVVPPADPERLANALSALLSDERERLRLGAAARATVVSHFTWAACGNATLQAYEDAL